MAINLLSAASIVRENIQFAVFDNTHYPSPGRMLENLNNDIPQSLTHLVEQIILRNKRSNVDHLKLVCTNICHSIMACTHCQGRSCSNVESPTIEDSYDINEEPLLRQFTCTQTEEEDEEEEEREEVEEGSTRGNRNIRKL